MKLTSATYLNDYSVELFFSGGEKRTVDFRSFLSNAANPMTKAFLDLSKFKNFQVTHGYLSWNNGEMDFSADSLYSWNFWISLSHIVTRCKSILPHVFRMPCINRNDWSEGLIRRIDHAVIDPQDWLLRDWFEELIRRIDCLEIDSKNWSRSDWSAGLIA